MRKGRKLFDDMQDRDLGIVTMGNTDGISKGVARIIGKIRCV
jgi:hypothetical protein